MVGTWNCLFKGGWNSRAYEIGTTALAIGIPLTLDYFFNPVGFWHAMGVLFG